jgi:Zinc carboxypeptidase
MMKRIGAYLLCLLFCNSVTAQTGYSNFVQQTNRINALAKAHPQWVKVKSLTKTNGGKDIWQITIGASNSETKPAIAVVGGVEGNAPLSTELAIGFAEQLMQGIATDSIKNLLNKTTFYIFPNMSPEAMEQYFASLRYERLGNGTATDDDRDGNNDEDGYDDLDGNGKITWMRVESLVGTHRVHPNDARVLIRADASKGEKGTYLVFTEGKDNDKDGSFNEDGEGGVWFNKNLSFKHPSFSQGSGEYPASEKETRALLDELFDRFNVYAVISYSSNNNLSTPLTFNPQAATAPVLAGWLQPDTKVNSMVSDLYNKTVGLKDAPASTANGGDLLSWGYYHYGRFSFSTPGWWVPITCVGHRNKISVMCLQNGKQFSILISQIKK